MQTNVHAAEIVFLLLLFIVVFFGAVSKKLKIPYPIALVSGMIGAQLHRREWSEPAPATATNSVLIKDEDSDLTDLNLN